MGLVLTMKPDESFEIQPGIKIKLIKVRGKVIKLLVQAPREIKISRVYTSDTHTYDTDNKGDLDGGDSGS